MCMLIWCTHNIHSVKLYTTHLSSVFQYINFSLIHKIPHHGIKDPIKVKEHFCLGTPFDPKELDRRVTFAHSYKALPSYMGIQ